MGLTSPGFRRVTQDLAAVFVLYSSAMNIAAVIDISIAADIGHLRA